ncbi:TetR/AcrR family transcriptional regulator [Streptomyces kaempferi]
MTTRKYTSTRRVNSAAATREAILSSAHALFLARGYAGVTIGEIAEAGNVAVPTVYSSVGSKPSILTALLELGPDGPGHRRHPGRGRGQRRPPHRDRVDRRGHPAHTRTPLGARVRTLLSESTG